MVGGTLGYNWQVGQIVFGAEGDFDYGFLKSSNGFNNALAAGATSYQTNWMTTERLRLGYAIDRALFYVTGGYAGVSTHASIADSFNGFAATQNGWRSGGVIGGGIEYAFTNNISAKAEYLWAPMQDKTYWAGTPDQETNHMYAVARPRRPQLQVLICVRVSARGKSRRSTAGSFVLRGRHAALGRANATTASRPNARDRRAS